MLPQDTVAIQADSVASSRCDWLMLTIVLSWRRWLKLFSSLFKWILSLIQVFIARILRWQQVEDAALRCCRSSSWFCCYFKLILSHLQTKLAWSWCLLQVVDGASRCCRSSSWFCRCFKLFMSLLWVEIVWRRCLYRIVDVTSRCCRSLKPTM